jgi:hypothetical protein
MKSGDVVTFRNPADAAETSERFVVRELRGDRVLVAALGTGFSITPTSVYSVEELEVIAHVDGQIVGG